MYAATYHLLASPVGFTTDTTTQGDWNNLYGIEGYLIAYAAVKLNHALAYTYALPTNDQRALQDGPAAITNIASAYYGQKFNISFAVTDIFVYRVALYLVDYDTSSRSETLTVIDNNTGSVLDTETISNFHNGTYAMFGLQGNETLTVPSDNPKTAPPLARFSSDHQALSTRLTNQPQPQPVFLA